MKSYIQGLITGGIFVFSSMILIGSQNKIDKFIRQEVLLEQPNKKSIIGRYQIASDGTGILVIDTKTAEIRYRNKDNYWEKVLTPEF